MVGLASPPPALATQLNPRCVDDGDYDSTRSKKSKSSKSDRQPSQMGDVPDSEEDVGHTSSV